jgi:hypothetical protein
MKALIRVFLAIALSALAYAIAVPPYMSNADDKPRWYVHVFLAALLMLASRLSWPRDYLQNIWMLFIEVAMFAGFVALLFYRMFH